VDFTGRRFLVVEDEAVLAMLIEDMLGELGCTVAATAGGTREALKALEDLAIDGAILDVNLGRERSYRVADALIARGVPFVFATGSGDQGVDAAYRGPPVLQKPFDQDDLARALSAALSPRS
jgi:CheY-like chemotaxis protein